jgi:anti-anti-sigma factor
MELHTKKSGEITVVSLWADRIDLGNAGEFRRLMTPVLRDSRWVVLDLSKVAFVDSSGFGAILGCSRDLKCRGGELKIALPQRRVRLLLELVRIHKVIEVIDAIDTGEIDVLGPVDAAGSIH